VLINDRCSVLQLIAALCFNARRILFFFVGCMSSVVGLVWGKHIRATLGRRHVANLLITRNCAVGVSMNVFVDTSPVACMKFGWRHGDRFIDHQGNLGEVMGVGIGSGKEGDIEVLWVILDRNRLPSPNACNGYATYYRNGAGTADASKACLRPHNPLSGIEDLLGMFGGKKEK